MLIQRVLTAALALPMLLWIIVRGERWQMLAVFLACVAISVHELSSMVVPSLEAKILGEEHRSKKIVGTFWYLSGIVISVILFFVATQGDYDTGRSGIALGFVVLMLVGVFTAKSIDRSMIRTIGLLVTMGYAVVPWLAVWDLYILKEKSVYLFLLFTIVMGCDTGAYFGGRAFGKRKLAPNLSPKKTWEGAFFGILTAILSSLALNHYYDQTLGSDFLVGITALFGGIAGILGDLLESGFKRFAGVKDSGVIFPGHGGFLDRVDAIIIAAPVVWVFVYNFLLPK
ncbi:MAG: phosphatidate cytidylyltransferase [Pseudomonadota bacterium]